MRDSETKERAHTIIDFLKPGQLAELLPSLEAKLNPFERSLLNALPEDELISEEEENAAAKSVSWLETNQGITHDLIRAEYSGTPAEWEEIGRFPVKDKKRAVG